MTSKPRQTSAVHAVKDLALAGEGRRRTQWAARDMPVLATIAKRLAREKPLAGQRISACLHVTTETANLMLALKAGGAELRLCASNPLSTQDDVAAHLVADHAITVFAVHGANRRKYYAHINAALDFRPTLTMDDGCDLVNTLHASQRKLLAGVAGGTEETTTGVMRLRAMEKQGALAYPVIAVNDADTKHLFDNRYGTGQSTLDGILRATNRLIAGRTVVVAGYGWCGRGFATRARGMGAHVIVTEVDATKALEAVMDGFSVMPMAKAASVGDLFVTLTGNLNVIDEPHFRKMKDGAVVCNSGHFDVEVNVAALRAMAKRVSKVRKDVEAFELPTGRRIHLLAEGRLVNLACAEGHPASVMDMSFAVQALAVEHLAKHAARLKPGVHLLPRQLDEQVASLKLASLGYSVDRLTKEQRAYLGSYEQGT
jgi:adenosylhomocysteinase